MANEVTVWNKVMSSALAIPGVQVDRETFLRSELRQYCSKDELEKAILNPVDVLSEDRIDSLANSCINNHLLKVTSLSVVAGIPGGLAMAATIPAETFPTSLPACPNTRDCKKHRRQTHPSGTPRCC